MRTTATIVGLRIEEKLFNAIGEKMIQCDCKGPGENFCSKCGKRPVKCTVYRNVLTGEEVYNKELNGLKLEGFRIINTAQNGIILQMSWVDHRYVSFALIEYENFLRFHEVAVKYNLWDDQLFGVYVDF